MTQRPLRICLILHSSRSDNLGVGALTASEVEILRDVGRDIGRELEITILDWKDARAPYVTGPDIKVIDIDGTMMRSPKGYFATARRSDLVIDIGAGDSFADIYGAGRLKRMFWLKYLTHLSGTPLVMAPQTVGPFTKGWSKTLAQLSMRLCKVVASRDKMSTEAARALGRADVIEASDVALRLPYGPPAPRTQGGPVKVGINVSGLLMGGGYSGKNEFGLTMDYPDLVRDLITYFQSHPDGCEVHLVPHVIVREGRMTGEDDYSACTDLAEAFPGTVLAPSFASPSEAKTYIAGLDFFMGARMHACIAAFSSGVPVMPMAYSRKFEGLFGSLGYTRTVDCTTESAEAIRTKIIEGFENRAAIKDETTQALAKGLQKLGAYQAALQKILTSV
ncbi:polysaccharide pyruvyl transferase family protein (plasmid) [Pseudorhodobacter turbinis]|uniref:Polysaccharide pyruvyl transferase family protein n=1 Tax=Pseudorhodobacter turbinis TaxID=2500533 RepID=A0A4P8ELG6_9RHOB|nr:polysaccharide pyruvyl transferase family protein [Pseudorhodobacter turbinis]QCO58131.1 polysaccharide pyruvyl transferase family protein [Pseudorhodobacter turbinis]